MLSCMVLSVVPEKHAEYPNSCFSALITDFKRDVTTSPSKKMSSSVSKIVHRNLQNSVAKFPL